MKKGVLIGVLLIVMIYSLNIISAAQPFISALITDEGYLIKVPSTVEVIKENEDFTFDIHVVNKSTGYIVTNSTSSCMFHLHNESGERQIVMTMGFAEGDFSLLVDGNNFTKGRYSYLVNCNDSHKGGFIEQGFIVNPSGKILGTDQALIYILLTLTVLFLFLLSLYFTLITPYSNTINEKGAIIKVAKTKYIKLGLILLSYILFVWVLNVLIGIADNFVGLTMYYGLVSFLFITLNSLALPVSIFIFVLSLFEIIRDTNIQKAISKFGSAKK